MLVSKRGMWGVSEAPRHDVLEISLDEELSKRFVYARPKVRRLMANYWYELKIGIDPADIDQAYFDFFRDQISERLEGAFREDLARLRKDIDKCKNSVDPALESKADDGAGPDIPDVRHIEACDLFSFNVIVSVVFNNTQLQWVMSHPDMTVAYQSRLKYLQNDMTKRHLDSSGRKGVAPQKFSMRSHPSFKPVLERKKELQTFCSRYMDSEDCFSDWTTAEEKCWETLVQARDHVMDEMIRQTPDKEYGCVIL